MARLQRQDVALLRVLAQGLAGGGTDATDATDVVQGMLAMQGQDLPGALVSVALRTAGRRRSDVVAALDAGTLVRSWPMRGTLHVVTAADVGWLTALCAPRVLRGVVGRWAQLGLDAAVVARAAEVAGPVLEAAPVRRGALLDAWHAAGLPTQGQAAVHLLNALAMQGLVCLGPMSGREQLVALQSTWVRAPRPLAGDAALAELAGRFVRGHGPVTERDLAWWARLPVTAARRALAAAPGLQQVEADGETYVVEPQLLEALRHGRRGAGTTMLLPGFDELLLGYRDRTPTLDPGLFERVVPGGNGMFRATVVHGGRIVAVWRRAGTVDRRTADVEWFTDVPDRVRGAVPRLLARDPWAGT